MEPQPTSSVLKFVSPAWPARLGGLGIFLGSLVILVLTPSVSPLIPAITFVVMILSVIFASETTVIADSTTRTLTVSKKRMVASSNVGYPFDDIAFVCQNITTSVNQKGEGTQSIKYTLGLNSQTGTLPGYFQGRKPIPLPIPGSTFTVMSSFVGGAQKLVRARELANFMGVQFYVNGGQNDTLANTLEDAPKYFEAIKNIPDALAVAKKENEAVARKVLGNKYPNQ